MPEPDWHAPIEIADHALIRARQRLGWDGSVEELTVRIRADVREGLLADRVAARRPNWTRGSGIIRNGRSTETTRYVWDAHAARCWVTGLGASGRVYVKTVLLNPEAHDALTRRAHLRPNLRSA